MCFLFLRSLTPVVLRSQRGQSCTCKDLLLMTAFVGDARKIGARKEDLHSALPPAGSAVCRPAKAIVWLQPPLQRAFRLHLYAMFLGIFYILMLHPSGSFTSKWLAGVSDVRRSPSEADDEPSNRVLPSPLKAHPIKRHSCVRNTVVLGLLCIWPISSITLLSRSKLLDT